MCVVLFMLHITEVNLEMRSHFTYNKVQHSGLNCCIEILSQCLNINILNTKVGLFFCPFTQQLSYRANNVIFCIDTVGGLRSGIGLFISDCGRSCEERLVFFSGE